MNLTNQIDLSEFFVTVSQANDFKTRLENICEMMFETNFNLEKALTDQFGIDKKDKFIKLLRENNINDLNTSIIKDFIIKITEVISNIPILSLTIAIEPNEETLISLSQWFLYNLNKQILFDITINKNIIAGAMLNFNGKHKDYSIKPVFDEIINKQISDMYKKTASTPLHQQTEFITIGR